MEKKFLTGKTPDGAWLVTVMVDVEKKIKRLDFEKVASDNPKPPTNPEDPEWTGIDELLI